MSSDVLLALDEISECDPKDVGAIVYSLTNGTGKQRANRSGLARPVASWRTFALSTGERSIGASMAEGGFRQKAGQTVRLLDVPVPRVHGAWDNLHGFANGASFSDAIKNAAATDYGHAGKAFVEALSRDKETDFSTDFAELKTLPEFQGRQDAEGQVKRAAERFALLAFAGELASIYGVTPWAEGAATEAAIIGFEAWLKMREGGISASAETLQIERAIREFIERHGDSRFSSLDKADDHDAPVRDRAGWWRTSPEGKREYLFNSSGMREALKGFDFNRALDELEQLGFIGKAGADGKRPKTIRVQGGLVRLYPVTLVE
jgi:putative DNA primase/helicase